jgi:hypothetical protein
LRSNSPNAFVAESAAVVPHDLPWAKKAGYAPSGGQNGYVALSVPANARNSV